MPTAAGPRYAWVLLVAFLAMALLLPLIALSLEAPSWVIGSAVAVPLLGSLWQARHLCGGEWLGPHFFYDILRLARRGRSIGVRVFYVAALLLGLGYIFWGRFSGRTFLDALFDSGLAVSTNEHARLGEVYVHTIIILQNLAVLLLTPAYLASAVVEERERRTLELLFTSHLHNREIVFGKLLSRAVHMGGILLAGLPILTLSRLLGGVSMEMLLANFFVTFLNLVTVSSVCILVSVMARTTFIAVIASYGVILPFALCFSCLSVNGTSSLLGLAPADFARSAGGGVGSVSVVQVLFALLLVHGFISGTCLAVAISSLRGALDFDVVTKKLEDDYRPPVPRHMPIEKRIVKRQDRLHPLPPIDDQPLLWKEMYLGGKSFALSPAFWAPLLSMLIPVALLFLFHLLDSHSRNRPWIEVADSMNPVFRFFIILFGALFCLGVGYRACSSMVRERQQQTLDALLTLPVEDKDLLRAKWIGSLYKGWSWSIYYAVALFLGVVTGSVHIAGAVLLTVAPLVHGLFLASFGLFLSVVSRTLLVANMRLAVTILSVFALGLVGFLTFKEMSWWDGFLLFGLNPLATWYQLGFSYIEPSNDPTFLVKFLAAGAGLLLYAGAALVFWLLANRTFAKEEYRRGGFRA